MSKVRLENFFLSIAFGFMVVFTVFWVFSFCSHWLPIYFYFLWWCLNLMFDSWLFWDVSDTTSRYFAQTQCSSLQYFTMWQYIISHHHRWEAYVWCRVASLTRRLQSGRSLRASPHASPLPTPSISQHDCSTLPSHKLRPLDLLHSGVSPAERKLWAG